MALTRRQKQVLDLIAKFVDDNGYSPSYEELAQGLTWPRSPPCTSTSPR
jgi:repressor LexA